MDHPITESNIYNEGFILDISIGKEPWKTTLTPTDFGMEKFPDNFEPGRRKLLPDEVTDRIAYIEGRARRAARLFAFSFGSTKIKYSWIHISKLGAVMAELNKLKEEFFAEVDKLIANYEAHKELMKAQYPEQWPYLERAYIPEAAIRENYYFEFRTLCVMFPDKMHALDKFEIQQADLAMLAREKSKHDHETLLSQTQIAYAERLRAEVELQKRQAREQADRFVDEAVRTLRGKIVGVFSAITDKIKTGKPIIQSNLTSIRTVITDLRQMDFIGGDAEFNEHLEAVQQMLDSGMSFKDDASATQALEDILSQTVKHINNTTDTAIAQARQSFGRKLTFA
jgi:hypothetical protein